jgi:tRNA 2-thiouridine synthesizing protein A
MGEHLVDARGLSCPMPVIRTKELMDMLGSGEIKVLLDEEVAKENVSRLATSQGFSVEVSEVDGEYELVIRKGESA